MPKHNTASVRSQTGIHLADNTLTALSALDSMWAAIDAAIPPVLSQRPEGGFTTREFADRRGLKESTAKIQLLEAVKAGKLKASVVLLPDTRGRIQRMNVYTVAK